MKKLLALCSAALLSTVLSGCDALQAGGFPGYGGGYGSPSPVFTDPYPYDHGYWEGMRDQERSDWERERIREDRVHDAIERQRMHDAYVAHEHSWENTQRQHWERDHAAQIHQAAQNGPRNTGEQQRHNQEIAKQHQEIENKERADAAKNAEHQREIRERQIREDASHHRE